jgi:hypothetical protein
MSIPFIVSKNLPLAKQRGLGRLGLLSPLVSGKHHTSYEQLTCVGYHPELEELYAVISLKQPSGYSGGVCSDGTLEYVRFYMSFDDRATWQDMGVVTVPAYDLGAAAPVSAAVTLQIEAPAFPCADEAASTVHVRAILSWSVEPPHDTPAHKPSWSRATGPTRTSPSRKGYLTGSPAGRSR